MLEPQGFPEKAYSNFGGASEGKAEGPPPWAPWLTWLVDGLTGSTPLPGADKSVGDFRVSETSRLPQHLLVSHSLRSSPSHLDSKELGRLLTQFLGASSLTRPAACSLGQHDWIIKYLKHMEVHEILLGQVPLTPV